MFEALRRAIARRRPLRSSGTNLLRLVDGAGDGFPGVEVDDFDGRWLVATRAAALPDWVSVVCEAGTDAPRSVYWKRLSKDGKQGAIHVAGEKVDEPFHVLENGLRFEVDFHAGYSQGIFLDQRENRELVRGMARRLAVLNCFAYTCAFGVAAAAGGARDVVNIDLSRRCLEWGRRNFAANGIEGGGFDFIAGDVFDWFRRFARRGRRFDFILLDPPTFSRDRKGRVFTAAADFGALIEAAVRVLSPGGRLLCCTNDRGLAAPAFADIARAALPGGGWSVEPRAMPADFRGPPYLKTLVASRAP